MAPWTRRAVEILEEHGRLRRYELVAAVADLVPPGRGYRYRQRKVANNRRHDRLNPGKPHYTFEQQVFAGQRSIVTESLSQMVRHGGLLSEVIDGEVWLASKV